MTNWLADPAVCAIKAIKGGCRILKGRDEVMSRSTRAIRTEEHDGTYWRNGHLYARRSERSETLGGGAEITGGSHGMNDNHVVETAGMTPTHATVLSDLLRAAVVDAGGQACGGKTILEMLWEELDSVMERLMTGAVAEDGRDPGRAEGIAYAIALMQNPYQPNIDHVRMQAMARWEEAQSADPEPCQSFLDEAVQRRSRRRRGSR